MNTPVFTRIFCVLAVALSFGCATKKPLPYAFSPAKAPAANGPTLQVAPLRDARSKKDDMDKLLVLPQAVNEALEQELRNSGIFSKVETKTGEATSAEFALNGDLKRFEWEVPGHKQMVGTAFAVSLATGGIGGLAYGSTSTDVLGHVSMRFVVTGKDGTVILDKDYIAQAKERRTKLSSDVPKTRREMVAKALKDVVDQLLEDLQKAMEGRSAAGEGPSENSALRN